MCFPSSIDEMMLHVHVYVHVCTHIHVCWCIKTPLTFCECLASWISLVSEDLHQLHLWLLLHVLHQTCQLSVKECYMYFESINITYILCMSYTPHRDRRPRWCKKHGRCNLYMYHWACTSHSNKTKQHSNQNYTVRKVYRGGSKIRASAPLQKR